MVRTSRPRLVVSSVIRGICCERLAPKIRLGNRASELFLLGMFSMIDAIMDRPMDEVLSSINLSRDVRAGLVPGEGPLRCVLDLTIAFERGDWTGCARVAGALGIADEEIASTYHDASLWVKDVFAVA